MDCSPPSSSVHGNSPGKNTGVGCHFLLQGIFLTQGAKLHLLQFLQGNKAFLSHFTQSSVSEIPFSTRVPRNWAFGIISSPVLIWNERLPYCDTRVILQRWFSKRKRIKKRKRILNMWATGVGANETGWKVEKGEPWVWRDGVETASAGVNAERAFLTCWPCQTAEFEKVR